MKRLPIADLRLPIGALAVGVALGAICAITEERVRFRETLPELRAWPARESEPRVWTNGRHEDGVWVLQGKTFELRKSVASNPRPSAFDLRPLPR